MATRSLPMSAPPLKRFMAKITVGDGCWEWIGARVPGGYGQLWDKRVRKVRTAHQMSYEFFVGTIPQGLEIDHLCRNRGCVRPDHLEPVTHQENTVRSDVFQRKITHCPRGHEYTPENCRGGQKGKRACKTCHRDRAREKASLLRAV